MFFLHFFCFCFSFALSLCFVLLLTHSLTQSLPSNNQTNVEGHGFVLPPCIIITPQTPHHPPRPLRCLLPLPSLPQVPDSHLSSLLHLFPPSTPSCIPASSLLRPLSAFWHATCRWWTSLCVPSAPFPPLPLPSSRPTYSTGARRTWRRAAHTVRSCQCAPHLISRPPRFCTAVEQQGACLTAQDGGSVPLSASSEQSWRSNLEKIK